MSLNSVAIESALSANTQEVWLLLLEIYHPLIVDEDNPENHTFYLVNNTTSIISKNKEYLSYPFTVVLADDDGEKLPEVKLTIDNVDQTIIKVIREIVDSPQITIKLILASIPDEIQMTISGLSLRDINYDSYTITSTLYSDDILNSRFPADTISLAGGYLGLFK